MKKRIKSNGRLNRQERGNTLGAERLLRWLANDSNNVIRCQCAVVTGAGTNEAGNPLARHLAKSPKYAPICSTYYIQPAKYVPALLAMNCDKIHN